MNGDRGSTPIDQLKERLFNRTAGFIDSMCCCSYSGQQVYSEAHEPTYQDENSIVDSVWRDEEIQKHKDMWSNHAAARTTAAPPSCAPKLSTMMATLTESTKQRSPAPSPARTASTSSSSSSSSLSFSCTRRLPKKRRPVEYVLAVHEEPQPDPHLQEQVKPSADKEDQEAEEEMGQPVNCCMQYQYQRQQKKQNEQQTKGLRKPNSLGVTTLSSRAMSTATANSAKTIPINNCQNKNHRKHNEAGRPHADNRIATETIKASSGFIFLASDTDDAFGPLPTSPTALSSSSSSCSSLASVTSSAAQSLCGLISLSGTTATTASMTTRTTCASSGDSHGRHRHKQAETSGLSSNPASPSSLPLSRQSSSTPRDVSLQTMSNTQQHQHQHRTPPPSPQSPSFSRLLQTPSTPPGAGKYQYQYQQQQKQRHRHHHRRGRKGYDDDDEHYPWSDSGIAQIQSESLAELPFLNMTEGYRV